MHPAAMISRISRFAKMDRIGKARQSCARTVSRRPRKRAGIFNTGPVSARHCLCTGDWCVTWANSAPGLVGSVLEPRTFCDASR